jgi:Tfp pilus assembly protein PilV
MREPRLHALRGASLIEALVALAVMGFGILGIAGIQSTLRSNGDLSKQQAEATRIAQQVIEESRSFTQLPAVVDPEVRTYEGLVSGNLGSVQGTNATFDRALAVTDLAPGRAKLLTVTVSWTDRANQPQEVRLTTNVSGVPPGLGASLSVAMVGRPLRMPLGRHAGIPPEAVDQGNGTSSFSPPGAGTTRWIFSNNTGVIAKICADGTEASCINAQSFLLTGFVRFEVKDPVTPPSPPLPFYPPTARNAESPDETPMPGIGVVLQQSHPSTASVACLTRNIATAVEYFCAVPVTDAEPRWSGRALVTGLTLAPSVDDPSPGSFRVCRYTKYRAHSIIPDLELEKPIPNADHPLDYSAVDTTLIGQNFLVIRAGFGTTAFDCPPDDTSTPLVNGNTWHHQPAT